MIIKCSRHNVYVYVVLSLLCPEVWDSVVVPVVVVVVDVLWCWAVDVVVEGFVFLCGFCAYSLCCFCFRGKLLRCPGVGGYCELSSL